MVKIELIKKLLDCKYDGEIYMTSAAGPVKVGGVVGTAGRGYTKIILYDEDAYKQLTESLKEVSNG
jgi:hypothetical protein